MLLSRNFLQLETEPQEDVTVTKDQPTTGNKPGGQVSSVVYTYVCHLVLTSAVKIVDCAGYGFSLMGHYCLLSEALLSLIKIFLT